MYDPFITAINTQKSAYSWFDAISENLGNIYTPGYRAKRSTFADFVNGTQYSELNRKTSQGKAIPGRAPSNLFVEGEHGYFAVRNDEGKLFFTRLGDFKFNAEGTLVNEAGMKVQGYLLGENGEVIDTGESEPSASANNPTHSSGGPGHSPTTEINLWVDPSNGKFFGKFDEYKVRSDGTVVGLANKGKTATPLYRVALANFVNPGGLHEVKDHLFIPTEASGEPLAGYGEVRSGLLEQSNVKLKEQVAYLQQARLQINVTAKLISTNKNLLEEALRLIQ